MTFGAHSTMMVISEGGVGGRSGGGIMIVWVCWCDDGGEGVLGEGGGGWRWWWKGAGGGRGRKGGRKLPSHWPIHEFSFSLLNDVFKLRMVGIF